MVAALMRVRLLKPTSATWMALGALASTIAFSLAFLLSAYPALPELLPVHFTRGIGPNGWQYKTYGRVLMPVLVQIALAAVFGLVALVLLSRPLSDDAEDAPDVAAAAIAAEAVTLFAFVW